MFFVLIMGSACSTRDHRLADRSSVGIAATPQEEPAALVQIYQARAFEWRGYFAVHCWIATKEKNADHYLVYYVTGWRLRKHSSAVVVEKDLPDRKWFDAEPSLIFELRGESAENVIPKIKELAENYPHAGIYRAWPGPNSNTFISYIIRNIPELGVELPPHAIGKDWLVENHFVAKSETGTGAQLSIFGLLGITLGLGEGFELNLLGLNLGVDVLRPALKLPLIGRLGMTDRPISGS